VDNCDSIETSESEICCPSEHPRPVSSCASVIANVVSLQNARNEEFKDYIKREMLSMDKEMANLKTGRKSRMKCQQAKRNQSAFPLSRNPVSSRFPEHCSGVIIPKCRNCTGPSRKRQ